MPGVRIIGARIVDDLDLADCARPGTELPALVLEDCDIDGPLDLTAARLSRLSLARSRFGSVDLREAYIDGPCDFSGTAADLGQRDCWIDARGALINGDVTAIGRLLTVRPRHWNDIRNGDRRYALSLTGCTIHGTVRLHDFQAMGGVSFDASNISGDLRISDARIESREGDALRAQNATIEGIVIIRKLVTRGTVWMLGLRTGGALQFDRSELHGERRDSGHDQTPDALCNALILGDADIGASARLTPDLIVHGRVSFEVAKIRGSLDASEALFSNRTKDGKARAVNLTNAEIGANLLLDGAQVEGRLDMAGARIGGKMSCQGIRLSNRTEDRRGQALEAINAVVGGSADFGPLLGRAGRRTTRIGGAVDFTSARIGGDMLFNGAAIRNFRPDGGEVRQPGNTLAGDGGGVALKARQLFVQANVMFTEEFRAHGALMLTGATIGRDLRCVNATLFNPARSALYAKDIEIGDDIKLHSSVASGDLRFERAVVSGNASWQNLVLRLPNIRVRSRTGRPPSPVQITLNHAKVGSKLICGSLHFAGRDGGPAHIDLRGATVATIDLASPDGWGNPDGNDRYRPVSLDGMTYQRINFDPISNDSPARRVAGMRLLREAGIPVDWRYVTGPPIEKEQAAPLLDWILRDCLVDGTKRFNPQPFRQLARVLRAQGHEAAACNVAMCEKWAATRDDFAARIRSAIAGIGFGFGLWPNRAALVLALYIGGGWIAAMLALDRGWLVETPQVAAVSYVEKIQGQAQRAFTPIEPAAHTHPELPCGYIKNWFFDTLVYAADTVLPFIPLHQESKCELRAEESLLRFLRAIYTIIGWVITSAALLTFTGALKRSESDEP